MDASVPPTGPSRRGIRGGGEGREILRLERVASPRQIDYHQTRGISGARPGALRRPSSLNRGLGEGEGEGGEGGWGRKERLIASLSLLSFNELHVLPIE